jgi:endonuclease I
MFVRSAKYYSLLFNLLLWSVFLKSQPPGYYSSAEGLTGIALQQALHDIIDNHTVVSYNDLWTHFQSTDKKSDGKVWDMYSDIPGGTPLYSYTFIINQCGSDNGPEGYCYNREHSFPKSWFNDGSPMYTDLFHIYPTDYWVNNKRGNYPFGVTSSPTWTSTNGSKLGSSTYPGYTGIVFEPINEYKGDFARTYFYMAVRYYREDTGWTGSDMVTGSQLKEWALNMLMEWDQADPVSQKEKDRNAAVYSIQGNRNPFIDVPAYTNLIWGTQSGINDVLWKIRELRVWPNPAKESITVKLPYDFTESYEIKIVDISGRVILNKTVIGQPVSLDIQSVDNGLYFLVLTTDSEVFRTRIVVLH